MEMGFWEKLKASKKPGEPIVVLAPMADVTDQAFRRIIAKYSRMGQPQGGPDVLWTEFVSADGLAHPIAREKLLVDLKFTPGEHPIVAQLFTSKPENMKAAAAFCRELGFDGIDINMGCPDRSIEKQGCGAAMIKDPKRAREVIRAAIEGAGGIPVSVKTRIGYNKNELDTWVPELLSEDIAVLTIHARTRKEMSAVPARWEHVKEAVAIRDKMGKKTLIFGNGDVKTPAEAVAKVRETGADGVMIGRGIFGNPWLFDTSRTEPIPLREKLTVLVEHTKLFEELLGNIKSFAVMKKHYKAYVNNFEGASELRAKLMETQSASEVEAVIAGFLGTDA